MSVWYRGICVGYPRCRFGVGPVSVSIIPMSVCGAPSIICIGIRIGLVSPRYLYVDYRFWYRPISVSVSHYRFGCRPGVSVIGVARYRFGIRPVSVSVSRYLYRFGIGLGIRYLYRYPSYRFCIAPVSVSVSPVSVWVSLRICIGIPRIDINYPSRYRFGYRPGGCIMVSIYPRYLAIGHPSTGLVSFDHPQYLYRYPRIGLIRAVSVSFGIEYPVSISVSPPRYRYIPPVSVSPPRYRYIPPVSVSPGIDIYLREALAPLSLTHQQRWRPCRQL
ncbi:Hypothetical predicted protein [Pelobates cultripes]|uniref:Uncharacterized protein n=1 Tax=Pelobates cultripes TaxID=61616 RepID=A0AAD1TBJ0_PELCU|nr:Hypothetical predicted protein [Pelobates cultripes]